MTRTPVWLWAVLVSPIPPCWYAVVASGPGVDDRAFLWVGIGAVLPVALYATNRLLERVTRDMQRRFMLPGREEP